MDRVTRRKFHMAQDSDDPLFVVNIVVWVSVVILAIEALHCLLPRRVVRWCTIRCNKSVISLLGLILYHFYVFSYEGTLQSILSIGYVLALDFA